MGLRSRLRRAVRQLLTARGLRRSEGLRLHLGCGQKRLEGFINIDMNPSPATDYVGDLAKLPCAPDSVNRIETYHVIEHIPRPAVMDVLSHWLTLLEPGGVLVMECPDLGEDVREFLEGNAERLFSIFGRQRFPGDTHYWGYTAETLTADLEALGFVNVRNLPATDYHAANEPCIRIEAQAP